jgi:hypothetical protein
MKPDNQDQQRISLPDLVGTLSTASPTLLEEFWDAVETRPYRFLSVFVRVHPWFMISSCDSSSGI